MPPTNLQDNEDDYHGDTIVVKGEYWTRQSSPDSMSPEIDINSLLHHMNNANPPTNLESPEPLPLEEDISNSAPHRAIARPDGLTSTYARPKPKPSHISTMEERLMMMPELRALPWREGVEPGADNETGGESRRKQIRFGCLLATRGEIQAEPCVSCANGRGKFTLCVALDGYFKGACASCQLSGRPNRCSIKKNDEDNVLSPNVASTPAAPPRPTHPSSEGPQAKRRKKDKVPEWETTRPQWEQELGDSHARQQMNERAGGQPWASVNQQISTPTGAMMIGMNGSRSVPTNLEHRNSLGSWATVNQAVPPPQIFGGQDMNGGSYRSNVERSRREETANFDDGTPLIDTLPKNKQRQIYGLVSGIQGGIDHLQRELESLKKALGIDDED